MRFDNLPDWLKWQEKLHFTEVDPGLERVGQVWQQLQSDNSLPFKVITVAGTNGKGSSVAMLDSILRAAGYKVGCYTSPHLLNYNERITVDGLPCDDASICAAFELIDQARQDISLTYFEFATLASVLIFNQQAIDIAILEVGMGGRLDAVNLFDADIALITPIGLDHTLWLGNDIETIAAEKAGILRANKPVVCSEISPPIAIKTRAMNLNSDIYCAGVSYRVSIDETCWHWKGADHCWDQLQLPALKGSYQIQNAAAVLQVISLLVKDGFTISKSQLNEGLEKINLPGRFELVTGDVELIFDVTHNEQGAKNLAMMLDESPCSGKTLAVIAMLKDKDSDSIADVLMTKIDKWFLAGLTGNRGMSVDMLASAIVPKLQASQSSLSSSVEEAYNSALAEAEKGDRILIFGSFLTVEAVKRLI